MDDKVEFIESYIKRGSDYQWCDNHGELVRCKDCKHKNEYECNKLTVSGVKVGVNDNWFCADGERKDGDLGG